MRLSAEHIEIIAYRVVHDLARNGLVAVESTADLEGQLTAVIGEEIRVEGELNDEVRDIMKANSDQIQSADVEFHDMFQVIKARLAHERNIII